MVFFQSNPNLLDDEKARIEFHLQQIAECIGFDRFQLEIQGRASQIGRFLFGSNQPGLTLEDVISLVGNHLSHDVGDVRCVVVPMQLEKSGGGG